MLGKLSVESSKQEQLCSDFSSRRWLFIIEGAITIAIAVIAIFILPNFPRTTGWLSTEEKQLATWRLEEDIGEDDWVDSEHQSFLHGAMLAFSDIKTWILVRHAPYLPNCVRKGILTLITILDALNPLHRLLRLRNKLLPHRRRNPQLREHRNPPPHRTPLCPRRNHRIRKRLARGPHRRALLPHHTATLHRRRSLHNRRNNHRRRAPLPLHDAHGPGPVYGVRRRARLDLEYTSAAGVEARGGSGGD